MRQLSLRIFSLFKVCPSDIGAAHVLLRNVEGKSVGFSTGANATPVGDGLPRIIFAGAVFKTTRVPGH